MSGCSSKNDSSAHVKLWVGNLPIQLTEYQLLKIMEKFGNVTQYDFLYNISEAGKRTPRGYAFVTYPNIEVAEKAMCNLNKTPVLGRDIVVRLANPKSDHSKTNRRVIPAALKAGSKQSLSESEKAFKIRQLEEKLKKMENSSQSEFKISSMPLRDRKKPYTKN